MAFNPGLETGVSLHRHTRVVALIVRLVPAPPDRDPAAADTSGSRGVAAQVEIETKVWKRLIIL